LKHMVSLIHPQRNKRSGGRISHKRSILFPLVALSFLVTTFVPVLTAAADTPQINLSTSSGRPGETLGISAVDPCPPLPTGFDYQYVEITFVDANNEHTTTQYGAVPDTAGYWDATSIAIPWRNIIIHQGPTYTKNAAAAGAATIQAKCIAGQAAGDEMDPNDDILQTTQNYAAEPFTVVNPSFEFTLSTSSVSTGQTVHVASTPSSPCYGERASGSISSNQAVSNFDAYPDSNGNWSIDVIAASEDMDMNHIDFPAGEYIVRATCLDWSSHGFTSYGAQSLEVTGSNYVALGDSYSSGEGLDPFEPGTDIPGTNTCHRSSQAYPRLLAGDADLTLDLGTNGFAACSGAKTSAITLGTPDNNEGAQMDKITADTELITMTIGGNNMDFAGFASECFWNDCSGTAKNDAIANIVNDVIPQMEYTLGTIRDRLINLGNSDARVVVIGYPQLVTANPYGNGEATGCEWLDGTNEAAAIRDVTTHLNTAIKNEVDAIGYDFHFLSANGANSPFAGHELCRDSLVYGMPYFLNVTPENTVYSFHPNSLGQEAYATLVKDYLSDNPL